jgi:hypothetical protein
VKVLPGRSGAEVTDDTGRKSKSLTRSRTGGCTEGHRETLLLPIFSIHHALDSVAQVEYVKIDQQAYADAAESHVGQELGVVNWVDRFDGFYFHDDEIFDHQVDAITEFDFLAVVEYRQPDLDTDRESALFEFMRKTRW